MGLFFLRFFLRACSISAANFPVGAQERWLYFYLRLFFVHLCYRRQVGASASLAQIFALVIVGNFCLRMCRLVLRHCLGYLASRIPSSKVPLLVLCVSLFFVLCLFLLRLRWLQGWMMRGFLWLPSAVLPRLRFFPHICDFRASFGEFCSCLGNFSACTLLPWLLW